MNGICFGKEVHPSRDKVLNCQKHGFRLYLGYFENLSIRLHRYMDYAIVSNLKSEMASS